MITIKLISFYCNCINNVINVFDINDHYIWEKINTNTTLIYVQYSVTS